MKYITLFILVPAVLICSCNYFFPRLTADKISVKEAYSFLQKHSGDKDVVLLDVRTKLEYDSLHIENSVLTDYSQPNFPEEIEKLDRNKTYLIYDKTDRKSSNTFELMKELRFKDVHVIIGGIEAWEKENLPLVFK